MTTLGANLVSVLAETADITYSGNAATERAEVRQETQKFAEAAIANSKREGLLLAVRARWIALAVTAVTIPIINPHWDVLYYVAMIIPFAVIGWAQRKVGKAGRSGPELFLMFCDLALMTFLVVVPNPFHGGLAAGDAIPIQHVQLFLHLPGDSYARLFMANGDRNGFLDRGSLGHRGRLDLLPAGDPRRIDRARARRHRP